MARQPRPRRNYDPGRSSSTGERTIGIFLLGLVLLFPPFLTVFNRPAMIAGVPVLYLYLFVAWGLVIALIAVVVERHRPPADDGG